MPVAFKIASLLNLSREVIVCQKIPVPYKPEVSFGAVSEGGFIALNQPLIRHLGISDQYVRHLAQKEKDEIIRQVKNLPLSRPLPYLSGKTAVITDDGLASGYTMLAAVREVRNLKPKKIIVAVPCASLLASHLVEKEADKLIALEVSSKPLFTIADCYQVWEELSEADLEQLLSRA